MMFAKVFKHHLFTTYFQFRNKLLNSHQANHSFSAPALGESSSCESPINLQKLYKLSDQARERQNYVVNLINIYTVCSTSFHSQLSRNECQLREVALPRWHSQLLLSRSEATDCFTYNFYTIKGLVDYKRKVIM